HAASGPRPEPVAADERSSRTPPPSTVPLPTRLRCPICHRGHLHMIECQSTFEILQVIDISNSPPRGYASAGSVAAVGRRSPARLHPTASRQVVQRDGTARAGRHPPPSLIRATGSPCQTRVSHASSIRRFGLR